MITSGLLGHRTVLPQKSFPVCAVAERLCSSRPSDGKSAGEVAMGETAREIGGSHILVQKTGVEAVAGANRVDCGDVQCRSSESLRSALSQCSLGTKFNGHDRDH